MPKNQKGFRPDQRANIPDEYKPAKWLIEAPNRPANSETAVNLRDALYVAVGHVLSAWELLETLLAGEFQRLIGTDRISAMRAWGAVASSKGRVDLLIAAANIELSGHELARFKCCMDDINRLGNCRNLVAHGMVYYRNNEKWVSDDVRLPTAGPFVLAPAFYNTNRFRDGSFYLFSTPQIEAILVEIHKMEARVGALRAGDYRQYHRVSIK
jgi:hypothetical protein